MNISYNFITQNAIKKNHNFHTCVKQSVQAMVVTDKQELIFGMNKTNNYVIQCPRVEQNMKTGEGYHLCKEVCNQGAHAEIDAIQRAKEENINIVNATLYLTGHTYCCDNCLSAMKKSKIKQVFIINEQDEVIKEYSL